MAGKPLSQMSLGEATVNPDDKLTADVDPLSMPDLADMPMEDLGKLIDRPTGPQTLEDGDRFLSSDERARGAQHPDDKLEDAEQEAQAPEAETAEPEAAEPEQKPNGDVSARIEALERKLEMAALRAESAESARERAIALQQRDSGRIGALLSKMERQPVAQDDEDADPEPAQPPRGRSKQESEVHAELAQIRSERAAQAIESVAAEIRGQVIEYAEVLAPKGEDVRKVFGEALSQSIARGEAQIREELQHASPKLAQTLVRSVYKEAFADGKMAVLRHMETAAKALVEESSKRITEKKLAASSVKGTPSAGPAKRTGGFDPMTASLDDLRKAVDSTFGVHRGAGSDVI